MAVSEEDTKSMPMAASIISTLMKKKILADIERRMNAPRKHPAVRKMK